MVYWLWKETRVLKVVRLNHRGWPIQTFFCAKIRHFLFQDLIPLISMLKNVSRFCFRDLTQKYLKSVGHCRSLAQTIFERATQRCT